MVMKRGMKRGARKTSRTAKRTTRRVVSKKRVSTSGKKSSLSSAIRELESEIKNLNREKSDLKRDSRKTAGSLQSSRNQERALQQKIAQIIEKQARLNQRKKNLQVKIDRDADKINKISKIKAEISDI